MRIDLVSPDGTIEAALAVDGAGRLTYAVRRSDVPIILDARLEIDIRPGGLPAEGWSVVDSKRRSADQAYPILAGKSAEGRDRFNEATVALRERRPPHRRIDLLFRAYDDGIAFQYVIPEQEALKEFDIVAEHSEFRFAGNHRCWPIFHEHFQTSFESTT